ncbi:MAG: PRC-barrel domain containing protein, partial [Brevundimonas sp.]
IRVSKLVGSMVFGPQGQRVGTVDDVLVDASGRVVAVTLDVGAFLGVATRTVAVPMALLRLVPAAEAAHRTPPPAPTAPAGESAAGLLEDLMTRRAPRWQAGPADHVEVSLSRQDLAGLPAYAGD